MLAPCSKQLKWFGLFVVFLLLTILIEVVVTILGVLIPQSKAFFAVVAAEGAIFAATGIAGYCLYRNARALIPRAEKLPALTTPKV